ncbi:hypothetical protein [Streptomyces sp. NPDC056660]|uniref:hypothetical protein n=1 Tax=Streptomyces sp. NPDC056660 TaxID=3345897 RepID=UPI0036B13D32
MARILARTVHTDRDPVHSPSPPTTSTSPGRPAHPADHLRPPPAASSHLHPRPATSTSACP